MGAVKCDVQSCDGAASSSYVLDQVVWNIEMKPSTFPVIASVPVVVFTDMDGIC